MVIALCILFLLICIGAVVLVVCLVKRQNRGQPQGKDKVLYNRSGIDVKNQATGEQKGSYFEPAQTPYGTFVIPRGNRRYNSAVNRRSIVLMDVDSGASYSASFQGTLYIGRDGEYTGQQKLILSGDSKISREHCLIFEFDGMLYIQDCGSTNHTFLNGNMVEGTVRLERGAMLQLGNTRLLVNYG